MALRVLIVDDDPLTLRTVQRVLRHAGHETSALSSGFGFAEVLRAFEPDVVLLDVNMPGLGGSGALRSAREIGAFRGRQPRIVLHSGLGATELKHISDALAADGYLCKPASQKQLLDALEASEAPEAATASQG